MAHCYSEGIDSAGFARLRATDHKDALRIGSSVTDDAARGCTTDRYFPFLCQSYRKEGFGAVAGRVCRKRGGIIGKIVNICFGLSKR